MDIDVGGDLTILYCSEVEKFVENAISLTKVLSWQHIVLKGARIKVYGFVPSS